MRSYYIKFRRFLNRRWKLILITFITLSNFGIGLVSISSPNPTVEKSVFPLEPIDTPLIQKEEEEEDQPKETYEYYFRVDYTIIHGVCKPIQLFNTTENILSIENLTNIILNTIARDVTIDFNIISINPILIKTDQIRQNVAFKYLKRVCNYVLELYIGFNIPSLCHSFCQLQIMNRLTTETRPFGHPVHEPFTFILHRSNSHGSKIKYQIDQVLLFQSCEYLNKLVYIRSYDESHYLSALILDASGQQTSITTSKSDRSLFKITTGLDQNSYENSCSDIYLSFLTALVPNIYLRHENGKIKLRKNDQSYLFKQDATFKLLKGNQNKNLVAFQSINVPQSYLSIDSETKTSLILSEPKLQIKTIDDLDNRFLFELIYDQ